MTMSQVPTTITNYSWTCLPTSIRRTPPKMRMRSKYDDKQDPC
jgi:hypothetical protein